MSNVSPLNISIIKENNEDQNIRKTDDELIEELIVKHNSLVEIFEEYVLNN